MISKELRERIIAVLRSEDGYAQMYDERDEDDDFDEFTGSAFVNWQSMLLTILYLKLEKDGEVPGFSSSLDLDSEDRYLYIPFVKGDTDTEDIPKCTLIKKCLTEAGFVFPRRYNYAPELERTGYGYNSVYAPQSDRDYSVNTSDIEDIDIDILLMYTESFLGMWGDDPDDEVVASIRYLKKVHLEETGKASDCFMEYDTLTDKEYDESEMLFEDALQTVANVTLEPFAFFCMYHPKWQKVRKIYYEETARANAAGEEPRYPFSLEAYTVLDKEVTRIVTLASPGLASSYYYDVPVVEVDIGDAPAKVQLIPDVNTEADQGYGHAVFIVNPLLYVTPELPLIYNKIKEKIDAFYAEVFPNETN